jgi:trk system potassium uptake protein TrkH
MHGSVLRDPSRMLVLGFAAAVLLGGALLALPVAHRGAPVGFIDALFTAASAVCVTGLTVVDTGSRYSGFGQAVILMLIQCGGVGITTLSTALLLLVGERASLASTEAVAGSLTTRRGAAIGPLLRRVLAWTLAIEATGALVLLVQEIRRLPFGDALWHAVFHAVSAFCNAGFSLRPDNLVADRLNAGVVLPIALLIILGGLGFSVLTETVGWLRKPRAQRRPLSLHSKLVFATSAVLLTMGALGFAVLERDNLLSGAGIRDRLLTSVFASVTARTAGFNTVPYDEVTAATLYLTILLMLIGGCPGSTAGGIKATTAGVMFATARARLLGRPTIHLFGRGVPAEAIGKATTVFTLAILTVIIGVILLAAFEVGSHPHPERVHWSFGLFFETVSALGTVGLSTGITPELTPAGKVVLILLMFVGRLGPLTIAVAISRRARPARLRYAEERVMIG